MILGLLLLSVPLLAGHDGYLPPLLDNIAAQSSEYKNSAEHQVLRDSQADREFAVGDTMTFWSWMLSVMPPQWIQVPSTCRAVGEHCYIFVADNQWNIHMDQSDIDIILPYLEDHTMNSYQYGAIEMDIQTFGPIPDELDGDPRLIVFYSALGSFMGTMFDGYFSAYNQVTEEEAQNMNPPGHSNECEMIYMTCHPLNPVDPIRISVLSHELEHLIHWGGDVDEILWVDEGCAELAMVLFGLPDPIIEFPNQPDNSLILWNQDFADYVKVMLFYTFLYEHYDNGSLIADIVAEPLNSISGVSQQLTENDITQTFGEIFTDWTVANIVDNTEYESGRYGYDMLDMPYFSAIATHLVYPAAGNGTVSFWAGEYIRFYPDYWEGQLNFDLIAENPLDISIVYFSPGEVEYVQTFYDQTEFSQAITDFDEEDCSLVTFVISNPDYATVNYTYYAETEGTALETNELADQGHLCLFPNPVNFRTSDLRLLLSSGSGDNQNNHLEIYNLKGQLVKYFDLSGQTASSWNGKADNGTQIASGIYYCRAVTGNEIHYSRLIILK